MRPGSPTWLAYTMRARPHVDGAAEAIAIRRPSHAPGDRAPHGAGKLAISGRDRIAAGPGTRHRRVLTDHRPCTHGPDGRIASTRLPDRTCRTPAREGRLPSGSSLGPA